MMGLWSSLGAAFRRTSGIDKRRADRESAYQASVDCLATMMRADATKQNLERSMKKNARILRSDRFKQSHERSVH